MKPSHLTVDLHPGEKISLDGGRVEIEMQHKSGRLARLRVTAPKEVRIEKNGLALASAFLSSDDTG